MVSPDERLGQSVGRRCGGFSPKLAQHPEIQLVGIQESVAAVADRYRKSFQIALELFYSRIDRMIEGADLMT